MTLAYHHQGSDTKTHCTFDTVVACFSVTIKISVFDFRVLFFCCFPTWFVGVAGSGEGFGVGLGGCRGVGWLVGCRGVG